jgi:hypothetical protein
MPSGPQAAILFAIRMPASSASCACGASSCHFFDNRSVYKDLII